MQTGKANPVRNCGTNKVPRKWGISNGAKTTVAITLVVLGGLLAFLPSKFFQLFGIV